MEKLDGRTALITGGAGGLGRHVVRHFSDRGAVVHAPVRTPGESEILLDFLGGRAERVRIYPDVDLVQPEAVERVLAEADEGTGAPDILLNLAGGFAAAPIEETAPDLWARMLEANATSAFLCSRAVFPSMKRSGRGRIVNVSALPALEGGAAGMSAYAAAKAAVLNLTRSLSREAAGHGITVNALVPAVIDTPGNRAAMPEGDRSKWVTPQEIAEVLHFLVSRSARAINGAALPLRLD